MLKTNDIMTLDTICNEFVANLRAGDDSTPVIKLKPPYNIMTELDEISTGRMTKTAVEPEIIDKLYEVLINYDRLKYKVDRTKLLLQNIVKPEGFTEIVFIG